MDTTKASVPQAQALGPLEAQIRARCAQLAEFLVAKNRAYGNSAAEPVRVFSRANPLEQLWVRMDDKLSRLARGQRLEETDEMDYDTKRDLAGYLVLEAEVTRLPPWAEVVERVSAWPPGADLIQDRNQTHNLLLDHGFNHNTLYAQATEVLSEPVQKARELADLQARVRAMQLGSQFQQKVTDSFGVNE